jgi:hypothetical protein
MILREYDVVTVLRLFTSSRPYSGSETVQREPRVGDIATVVHELTPDDPGAPLVVEMVDECGLTVWLADRERDELEFISRP